MTKRFRKCVVGLALVTVSIPAVAWALNSSDYLMGLGIAPQVADYIYKNLIGVNSSGNVVIPVAASKNLTLTVGGTSEFVLANDSLKYSVVTGGSPFLGTSSVDAADDNTLVASSAAAYGDTRGAGAKLYGNEVATVGGGIDLLAGNVSTANVNVVLEHASSTFNVKDTTSGTVFTVTDAGLCTAAAGIKFSASIMETVAAGTSAQGDGPLTAGKFIHLVTGFDETKVATLPACASGNIGEVHFILNNTTNKFAKIFPASGGTINSLGANAAYTQGVTGQGGKVLMCACQAANQWYCA